MGSNFKWFSTSRSDIVRFRWGLLFALASEVFIIARVGLSEIKYFELNWIIELSWFFWACFLRLDRLHWFMFLAPHTAMVYAPIGDSPVLLVLWGVASEYGVQVKLQVWRRRQLQEQKVTHQVLHILWGVAPVYGMHLKLQVWWCCQQDEQSVTQQVLCLFWDVAPVYEVHVKLQVWWRRHLQEQRVTHQVLLVLGRVAPVYRVHEKLQVWWCRQLNVHPQLLLQDLHLCRQNLSRWEIKLFIVMCNIVINFVHVTYLLLATSGAWKSFVAIQRSPSYSTLFSTNAMRRIEKRSRKKKKHAFDSLRGFSFLISSFSLW